MSGTETNLDDEIRKMIEQALPAAKSRYVLDEMARVIDLNAELASMQAQLRQAQTDKERYRLQMVEFEQMRDRVNALKQEVTEREKEVARREKLIGDAELVAKVATAEGRIAVEIVKLLVRNTQPNSFAFSLGGSLPVQNMPGGFQSTHPFNLAGSAEPIESK